MIPMDDPFFRFFFGPGHDQPHERTERGLGSGVIIGPGIVVTNNHVVQDADEIKVTTRDNHVFEAKVAGTDPKTDLAVLKLKGDNVSALKPLALGDSSRLRLGDVVLAIGNPFGVGQTVTMGIVSAKGRSDLGIVDYEDFIQTDAAINPGNSGGALVDTHGDLVGINTAILSRSGGSMGIGFAIPSNMARPIVESLLTQGKVVRGWLGVSIQTLEPDMAKALGSRVESGVLVSDVSKGSPAEKGGLKRGDVIVSVDGKATDSAGELRNSIALSGANRTVNLGIQRGQQKLDLRVTLGTMPDDAKNGNSEGGDATSDVSGQSSDVRVEALQPALRKQLDVPDDVHNGVVVSGVAPDSAAARAGLTRGDVILELDRTKITSPEQFLKLWKQGKGNRLILALRHGMTSYVLVRP